MIGTTEITTTNLSQAPDKPPAETTKTAENPNTITRVQSKSKPISKPRKAKTAKTIKISPKAEKILSLQTEQPSATRREIAKQADVSASYVQEVLERYGLTPETVKDYKNNRADILTGLQHRIIKSITEQDIQKAPLAARMMAIGISFDKERLERGQTTQNIGQLIAHIEGLQAVDNSQVITVDN